MVVRYIAVSAATSGGLKNRMGVKMRKGLLVRSVFLFALLFAFFINVDAFVTMQASGLESIGSIVSVEPACAEKKKKRKRVKARKKKKRAKRRRASTSATIVVTVRKGGANGVAISGAEVKLYLNGVLKKTAVVENGVARISAKRGKRYGLRLCLNQSIVARYNIMEVNYPGCDPTDSVVETKTATTSWSFHPSGM